ncbi:MAG: response regulator transcription factor [Tepidisphaeraceae bacterium]|jgi:DNA-binding response OmpR family regulator
MPRHSPTVLIVEGDFEECKTLEASLIRHGFGVVTSQDSASAAQIAAAHAPDIAVIDLEARPLGGLELCRVFRQDRQTAQLPILIVSGAEDKTDGISALELGADDVAYRPLQAGEIIARIRALLRRSACNATTNILRAGPIVIDLDGREVLCDGAAVPLTATEFRILSLLAEAPGRAHSRSDISSSARDDDLNILDRTIDAHIKNIRKKLGKSAHQIETVRAFGYRLHRPAA